MSISLNIAATLNCVHVEIRVCLTIFGLITKTVSINISKKRVLFHVIRNLEYKQYTIFKKTKNNFKKITLIKNSKINPMVHTKHVFTFILIY